jgi:poly-gamma-glutamate capsule biosynthesis protein CapA/YwtB (metallophosphatase superfamily)
MRNSLVTSVLRSRFKWALLMIFTSTIVMLCGAAAQQTGESRTGPPDPLLQIPKTPIPCTIKDDFVFAAGGDLIGPGRPVIPDAGYEAVRKIMRGADIAFGNQEGSIFDLETFKGYPAAENGGGDPLLSPIITGDLKSLGIKMMSKANNHATDWGLEGLAATEHSLDDAGIVHAGSGRNLDTARAGAFLETPKGRVALVATASTFTPMSQAGSADGDVPGRPGISFLRTRRVTLVTQSQLNVLQEISAQQQGRAPRADVKEVNLNGQAYRVADKPGVTYEMNPTDESDILKAIRGAKELSSLVVFSIHAHETANGDAENRQPADFLPILFHNAIDAGADIVVTHGPHALHGVEIYKGKPIFYGLASLFFQMELDTAANPSAREMLGNVDIDQLTYAEYIKARFSRIPVTWFDSVLAVSEFRNGQLSEVRLYPLSLDHNTEPTPRPQGTPRLAAAADAQRILEEIQRDSVQFGTKITIENGIGIIRVTASH